MAAEDTTNQEAAAPAPVVDKFDYGTANEGVDAVTEDAADESNVDASDEADATLGAETIEAEVEESEELDIDGAKISLPKSKAEKLKAERLMHADYTKKTQEVAEHRKAVEQEREALANQAKAQQENIQEYATLVAIDHRLQQFAQVNWNQLNQDDPVNAQRLWIEYSQLKDAQTTVSGRIQQKEQQRLREEEGKALEKQQSTAKQIKECFDVVARDIKGWSPELAKDLTKTGIALGFSDEELTNVKDPRFVKMLHKAHIADQLLKKQTAVANPPKPPVKPVPQVGAGSAPAGKRLQDMDMGEYIKARRAQLR